MGEAVAQTYTLGQHSLLQEIQKAVGPEKLHLFIPGTVHGLFADHAVLFEAMAGVKKGDWSTGVHQSCQTLLPWRRCAWCLLSS